MDLPVFVKDGKFIVTLSDYQVIKNTAPSKCCALNLFSHVREERALSVCLGEFVQRSRQV